MAAHRYWRAVNMTAYGLAGLELSEFQLLALAVRVDTSATLTASIAPSTGSLANLKDDDLGTAAVWPQSALAALVLSWDFGSGGDVDVTDVRLAGGLDSSKFLCVAKLQYSDDATAWTDYQTFSGTVWPGIRVKTASAAAGFWLYNETSAGSVVLDNTKLAATAGLDTRYMVYGNTARSSGVYQYEVVVTSAATITAITPTIGVAELTNGVAPVMGQSTFGSLTGTWGWRTGSSAPTSSFRSQGTNTAYGTGFDKGDVIGVVVNFATGQLEFFKNGVSQGVVGSGFSGRVLVPALGSSNSAAGTFTVRFRGFAYPVAGAAEWEPRDLVVRRPFGRNSGQIRVLTAASIVKPYGATELHRVVRSRQDFLIGSGRGRVRGTTKDKGTPNVPVSERVRLYREQDGLLVRETWSAAGTGTYSFDYVDENYAYTVISYDHDKNFRAVVADGLNVGNGGVELIA